MQKSDLEVPHSLYFDPSKVVNLFHIELLGLVEESIDAEDLLRYEYTVYTRHKKTELIVVETFDSTDVNKLVLFTSLIQNKWIEI